MFTSMSLATVVITDCGMKEGSSYPETFTLVDSRSAGRLMCHLFWICPAKSIVQKSLLEIVFLFEHPFICKPYRYIQQMV
jgi:hypothetical protein